MRSPGFLFTHFVYLRALDQISSDQVKLNELNQWASELDGYLIACREAIHSHSSDKLNTKVILLQNIMDVSVFFFCISILIR